MNNSLYIQLHYISINIRIRYPAFQKIIFVIYFLFLRISHFAICDIGLFGSNETNNESDQILWIIYPALPATPCL